MITINKYQSEKEQLEIIDSIFHNIDGFPSFLKEEYNYIENRVDV